MDITIAIDGTVINGIALKRGATATVPDAQGPALVNAGSAVLSSTPLPPADKTTVKKFTNTATGLDELTSADKLVMGNSGYASLLLQDMLNRANAAAICNPRITTTPSALIAFGGTPSAGTVGYVNSGISTTGYTEYQFCPALANTAPDNGVTNLATLMKPVARMIGGLPWNEGTQTDGTNYWSALQGASKFSLASSAREQSPTAKLMVFTDDPKPIFEAKGYSSVVAVDYDDGSGLKRLYDSTIASPPITKPSLVTSSGGGYTKLQLDFSQVGGRKPRKIIWHFAQDFVLPRMWLGNTSTIYTPTAEPNILWLTDSLGDVVANGRMDDSYVNIAGDFLGGHPYCYGEGGTGFVAKSVSTGNNKRNHLEKLQNAATMGPLKNIKALILPISVNDLAHTAAQVSAAVMQCIDFATATWGPIPTWVVGMSGPRTSLADQTSCTTMETSVFSTCIPQFAASYKHVRTVRTMSDWKPWVSGIGYIGSTTGSGNADFLFASTDGTHFAAAGHYYWGQRVASAIVSDIRTMTGQEE